MRGLTAALCSIAAASAVMAASPHKLDALLDYSACTARAAVRLDDGRPDFAPIARAVAAACSDRYRAYVTYTKRNHPTEPVLSGHDLAISAVTYERKYGPARIAGHRTHAM